MSLDLWENKLATPNGQLIGGMYYYLLSSNDIQSNSIIGNCNAIHSVWWSPILDSTMVDTISVDYDNERFGKISGAIMNNSPKLNRITGIKNTTTLLKTCNIFDPVKRSNYRDPVNESKLLGYPYSYALITDYMNAPIELKYHEIPNNDNTFEIHAKAMLSDRGTYSIFVQNLKGDYNGSMEGNINSAPLDIPVGSSAYSQWSSTQKAQDLQNTKNSIMNANTGMISSGVGVLGSIMTGNINGVINSGFGAFSSYQAKQQAIGLRDAKQKDLSNTPRSMINTGSDVGFSMINGGRKIDLVRYTITDEYKEKLCDFFTLYGYKQSKLMQIDTRSRYYFNYIKTMGCNLKSRGIGIPKEHIEKLKNIYDNGVTFWHMDRANVGMYNYTYDNYEVNF